MSRDSSPPVCRNLQYLGIPDSGRRPPRKTAPFVWRLKPGGYTWQGGAERRAFNFDRLRHLVELPLPARKETTVQIRPA